MTPEKIENGLVFFEFEIITTNIDWSKTLKSICQQLLSLNDVLKHRYLL